jgi:hypothetical protein
MSYSWANTIELAPETEEWSTGMRCKVNGRLRDGNSGV